MNDFSPNLWTEFGIIISFRFGQIEKHWSPIIWTEFGIEKNWRFEHS
jgi:hypothetical protein